MILIVICYTVYDYYYNFNITHLKYTYSIRLSVNIILVYIGWFILLIRLLS